MIQHNVRCSRELVEALKERASREGLSLNELTRRILEAGLDKPIAGTPRGEVATLRGEVGRLDERLEDQWGLIEKLDRRLTALEELALR